MPGTTTLIRAALALVIALSNPVCVCHAATEHNAEGQQAAPAGHAAHPDGSPCGGHHRSDPGDDDHGPRDGQKSCGCPQLVATLAKPPVELSTGLGTIVAVLDWGNAPWSASGGCAYSVHRDDRSVKRAPTTLLGLHCALIV
jgi:hypothetical protein